MWLCCIRDGNVRHSKGGGRILVKLSVFLVGRRITTEYYPEMFLSRQMNSTWNPKVTFLLYAFPSSCKIARYRSFNRKIFPNSCDYRVQKAGGHIYYLNILHVKFTWVKDLSHMNTWDFDHVKSMCFFRKEHDGITNVLPIFLAALPLLESHAPLLRSWSSVFLVASKSLISLKKEIIQLRNYVCRITII